MVRVGGVTRIRGGPLQPPLPRPVWLLGWVSLFTDAATEMIYPLLPVYLSRVLGVGAVSLGVIEGVAEGVNSLLKIVSGQVSDRWSRRKPIVIAGYAISSCARPFIAVTSSWMQVLAIRALDRTGKGIRTAPRDAMLAQYATAGTRGRVYGFHRAMDHAGAIVGPLIAAAFLLAWPGEYRALFALTIVPGALAVWLLVRLPDDARASVAIDPYAADAPHGSKADGFPRRFWYLLAVILVFSLGNSADAFLLLHLSDAIGNAAWIPILWSALHVVKASTSAYGGALSDRVGRKAVIMAGWGIYAAVYIGFALVQSAAGLIVCFLIYGTYFGLTEGSEKAFVADVAPASRRGTAFGWYNAALGAGALLASVLFGVLYDRFGHATAFTTGAALAGAAAVLLALIPADKTVYS
jgi:MFS family permease